MVHSKPRDTVSRISELRKTFLFQYVNIWIKAYSWKGCARCLGSQFRIYVCAIMTEMYYCRNRPFSICSVIFWGALAYSAIYYLWIYLFVVYSATLQIVVCVHVGCGASSLDNSFPTFRDHHAISRRGEVIPQWRGANSQRNGNFSNTTAKA